MTNIDFKPVDEYFASQPKSVQGMLRLARSTIRKAAPGARASTACYPGDPDGLQPFNGHPVSLLMDKPPRSSEKRAVTGP